MSFKIYNTLGHKIEEFVPYNKDKVTMYTCGPTVYHYAHIGNLRSYICEDVLEKALNYCGYNVKRVMNITDVGHLSSDADTGEDKMLKGAKREHKTVLEIANIVNHDSHTVAKELHKHNCSLKPGRQRPVYQLDIHTNEIIGWYESCSDTAIKCFNNRRHNGHINDVVNGKRKSAYGYKWCYVDEYLESELDAAV